MTQQMQELVEELRSTGYHGREAWLPKIERRKGTMNNLRQLVNLSNSRRWLAAEQTADKSWHAVGTDQQHPIAVINLAHDKLKHSRAKTANKRPNTIQPVGNFVSDTT